MNHGRWCEHHGHYHGSLHLCEHYDNATKALLFTHIESHAAWYRQYFHVIPTLDTLALRGGP